MADSTVILKEYLLSLGFKIDQSGNKKFDDAVAKTGKTVKTLGLSAIGAATAVTAMVGVYAESMEKLYYLSRTSNTSVGQLKALGQAADKSGIGAERMQGAVEKLAETLRGTGGDTGGIARLIEGLGVRVQGRSPGDVLIDGLKMLKSLSANGQYNKSLGLAGALFGITDQRTFDEMTLNLDKLLEEYQKSVELQKDAGSNEDLNAGAAVEWLNSWREIKDIWNQMVGQASVTFLPMMRDAAKEIKELLMAWTRFFGDMEKEQRGESSGGPESQARSDSKALLGWAFNKLRPHTEFSPDQDAAFASYLSQLEKERGLPPGILMALMGAESKGDLSATSSVGAEGPFQFKPGTAKMMNVGNTRDPYDAARGAADYLVYQRQHGAGSDVKGMVAGYHDGSLPLGYSGASWEGKAEAARVERYIEQHNTFHIHGGSTKEVVEGVKSEVTNTNAQLVNNLRVRGGQ